MRQNHHSNMANTETIQVEEPFVHSAHFFHLSLDAMLIINEQCRIIQINQAALSLLNMEERDCLHSPLEDVLASITGGSLQYDLDYIRRQPALSDEWVWVDLTGKRNHLAFNTVYANGMYLFTLRDLSLYKKNEEDYIITSNMFKEVLTQVTDGVVIFTNEGKIVDVNGSFLKAVGVNKCQVMNKSFYSFLPENGRKNWSRTLKKMIVDGKVHGVVELQVEERTYFFEYTLYLNNYDQQYISVLKDITEKKLIEKQLNRSKEIFTYIFDQAIDAILLTDPEGIIQEVNDGGCRIFELEREELVGLNVYSFIRKKDKKYQHMLQTFNQNGAVREELFFIMGNGQRKLLEFTVKSLEDGTSNVMICRNVSERHKIEVQLRKSESRFRKIFNGMQDGLILWKNRQIIDMNEASSAILGIEKKSIVRLSIDRILNRVPDIKQDIEKMLKKLETQQNVEEVISFNSKDGKTKHLEFSTKRKLVSGMNLTIIKDVTERLELQEQLRKSDTLHVVGELAAGIAHEIRNPMTSLKGFIQLLQHHMEEDFSSYFNIISSELKRIDTIITEFLVLARPQAVQFEEKDIRIILQDTVNLMSAEAIMNNISFSLLFDRDHFSLICEQNQLKQVFINIIKNSIESMPDGGMITIQTRSYSEEYIRIVIRDEGSGIPEEKLKKLGEPFYTTKERGTGMGLMVSYKIIEEHSGWVDVKSKVGKGTMVEVFLPYRNKVCEPLR
ncbi:PAS domain S-box protein [Bacillus sp. 1P06AnD]|uniref:PAS domain S-box protein n=1 Tax=Bacillus sp. 1P06AnD TaxID=3132208 RepID=UPI0039A33AFB